MSHNVGLFFRNHKLGGPTSILGGAELDCYGTDCIKRRDDETAPQYIYRLFAGAGHDWSNNALVRHTIQQVFLRAVPKELPNTELQRMDRLTDQLSVALTSLQRHETYAYFQPPFHYQPLDLSPSSKHFGPQWDSLTRLTNHYKSYKRG